jgi:hypothetical protein
MPFEPVLFGTRKTNRCMENASMKTPASLSEEMSQSAVNSNESHSLDTIFDDHILREFDDRDVNATMETMVPANPMCTA